MKSLSSSFLIHLRSLFTELIAAGFVTSGPNTAYSSNPAVTYGQKSLHYLEIITLPDYPS